MKAERLRAKSIVTPAISWRGISLAVLLVCAALALSPTSAQAGTVIGPILPYFGPADSPFNPASFTHFYYDTFESGGVSVPGVSFSQGTVIPPGPLVDSVEGPGDLGHSFFTLDGAGGVLITFNAGVLGSLPTVAGLVWTDGDGPFRHFMAWDQNNNLIGSINDPTQKFFSTGGDNDPSNYRFFGATNAGGISKIFISNDGGGIEFDDLQFGVGPKATTAPEPSSVMLLGSALAGWGILRRKKK